jgi:two-component system, LytTR family, response regulator
VTRRDRVLIVDDEKPARARLLKLLERQPAVQVVGACDGGESALRAVDAAARSGAPVDILFLDIQMPEMDGFALLEALYAMPLDRMPVVVLVTAYDQYALRAFDAHAVDYLLKPYSDQRFDVALTKAARLVRTDANDAIVARMQALLGQIATGGSELAPVREGYIDRLAVKDRGRVQLIDVDDIRWIAATGVYVTIHVRGQSYLHREVLTRLETRLDPQRFVRIHRSHIVKFDAIAELRQDPHGDYCVLLSDGTTLRVSRLYRPKLEERLKQPL